MKKYFFLLMLMSCTSSDLNNNFDQSVFKISNDLSFDEVKILLERNASVKPFPNIDN